MFRYLGELLSLIFFFLLVRSAVTGIWQLLRGGNPLTRSGQQASPETMRTSGELRKDPVCGTFVSTSTAYTRIVDGNTSYFCSPECRDRFLSDRNAKTKWPKSSAVRS